MNYYHTETVNDHITAIHSLTGEILYLVEGSRGAALIDTCLGVGHLKALVDSLTEKPLTVLLTHGHLDHAQGAPEFDTVYLNKKDLELYKKQSPWEERKGYIKSGVSPEEFAKLTDADFVPPMPEKEFSELADGMTFDLGGISIQAFSYPGHTQGSMVFLLKEDRILILGDACNNSTFLFGKETCSVEEYRENTVKTARRLEGLYDRVFLSHKVMETGKEILANMEELCGEIMEGKTDDLPFVFMGTKACIAKRCKEGFVREDGKCGNLIYRKNHIWKDRRTEE